MKKHSAYWVFLLSVLFCGTLNAKVNNYVGAYVAGGEWSLLPSQSTYSGSLGGVGGVGFLYEMQAGKTYSPTRFLFDVGVGAQGGVTRFSQRTGMTATLYDQQDIQGDPFNYVYELKDRQDQYTNIAAQIPLMIGVQHRKFYMLAGVKVDANVWTKSNSTALLNTYGVYNEIIGQSGTGDLRDIPSVQFFENRPVSGGVKTTLRLNVNASAEIGGRLGIVTDAVGYDVPKRKTEFRLGVFADYGLLDIHVTRDQLALGAVNPADPNGAAMPLDQLSYNQGSTYPVLNTTSMVDNLVMNDIMSTSGFAKAVNNLVVGIKFTVLFQLPEVPKCVMCDYNSTIRSGWRGRGVKYEE